MNEEIFPEFTSEQEWIESMYLDYFNNFLTVDTFAEHYRLTLDQAIEIINKGRAINHTRPVTVNLDGIRNKKYKEWIKQKEASRHDY